MLCEKQYISKYRFILTKKTQILRYMCDIKGIEKTLLFE